MNKPGPRQNIALRHSRLISAETLRLPVLDRSGLALTDFAVLFFRSWPRRLLARLDVPCRVKDHFPCSECSAPLPAQGLLSPAQRTGRQMRDFERLVSEGRQELRAKAVTTIRRQYGDRGSETGTFLSTAVLRKGTPFILYGPQP